MKGNEFGMNLAYALLQLYELTRSKDLSGQRLEDAGAGELALKQAETLLGQALPVAVRAFYRHLDGGLRLHPAKVLRLAQLVQTGRVISTNMFDLRLTPAARPFGAEHETLDPRVQPLIWHREWWPIVEFVGGFLCVDMAPGVEGRKGQLIQVADPRHGQNLGPPRWVASGWFELLAHLLRVWQGDSPEVQEARGPSGGRGLSPTWFLAVTTGDLTPMVEAWERELVPVPEPTASAQPQGFEAQAWREAERVRAVAAGSTDPVRHLRTQPLWTLDRPEWRATDRVDWLTDPPKQSDTAARLQAWLRSEVPPRALLLESAESGMSDTLLALCHWAAEHADPTCPVVVRIDLADHVRDAAPNSLLALFEAEGQARGWPGLGPALKQAVQSGRCALILHHAEAFLPHRPELWRWLQALLESAPDPGRCRFMVGMSMHALRSGQDLGLIWARLSERGLSTPPFGAWLGVFCPAQHREAEALRAAYLAAHPPDVQPETIQLPDGEPIDHWHAALSWRAWLERNRPPEWSATVWAEVAEATFAYFDALTACHWREGGGPVNSTLMSGCHPAVVQTWPAPQQERCLRWWLDLENRQVTGTQLLDGLFVESWPLIRLFQCHTAGDVEGFSRCWEAWRDLGAEDMIQMRWRSLLAELPLTARQPGVRPLA